MKINIKIVEGACATAAPFPKKPSKMPNVHNNEEARMHRTTLAHLLADTKMLLDMIDDSDDLPEWLESKITKAGDYMASAVRYISGNIARDAGYLEEQEDAENTINQQLDTINYTDLDIDTKMAILALANPSEPS